MLDTEDSLPILEEMDEVLGDFFLGLGGHLSNGEASPDGLLDPVAEC